ncbi:MAG: HAD family phosphatase [Muribaculaceae bacterium]|nr:HAD family phosphatase [Muribaculaceae bacterium]
MIDWINNIRNVIFDLGGVVIDLDRDRAVHALEELGLNDVDDMLGLYGQKEPFYGLETGERSTADFFDLLRSRMKEGVTDTEITEAFNKFLVNLPSGRLKMLRRMREAGYRIFMLSNTNPVMYQTWIDRAFRQEGKTVNDYFDGIVVSFQELMCKPDVAIFQTLMRRYGLNPSETLMLDDSENNCNAAKEAGAHALCVGKSDKDDMMAICGTLLKVAKHSDAGVVHPYQKS